MMTDPRFDNIPCRRGTGSYKWDDSAREVIPLWVADMDFRVAEPIEEALKARVDHGVFGYTYVPDAYYEAIKGWYRRRHGIDLEGVHIIYTSGVVPAISSALKALTCPGDGVAVLTPVYNCFFSSIRNNGCRQVDIPLTRHDINSRSFTYGIDFGALRQALSDPRVPVLLWCNPHNPACRAWSREELQQVYDICLETGTILLSDEIHCDLVMPGYKFTSVASLDGEPLEHSVIFSSPSKAFNIAGLQIANIITRSHSFTYHINRAINDNEVCDVNPFGVTALIAAYNEGTPWLEGLIRYIHSNFELLEEVISAQLPKVSIAKLEATYLAWIDVSYLGRSGEDIEVELRDRYGVWVNCGEMYGANGGIFLRINLATSRDLLKQGLERIVSGLDGMLNREMDC